MVEDRGDHSPQELTSATNALVAAANKDPNFARVFTLYNAGAPSLFTELTVRRRIESVSPRPTSSRPCSSISARSM